MQRDRFLQNWRKWTNEGQYPRYECLYPEFESSWNGFVGLVENQDLGTLQPDQYELTYVNHIAKGHGWTDEDDVEQVFPWFKCSLNTERSGALERVAWRRVYMLPNETGRLHVSMKQALTRETKTPVLVLNLTARGFTESDMRCWFNVAHEWIVRVFADLTGPSIQKQIWKRQK